VKTKNALFKEYDFTTFSRPRSKMAEVLGLKFDIEQSIMRSYVTVPSIAAQMLEQDFKDSRYGYLAGE
jgi:hypothetical protein